MADQILLHQQCTAIKIPIIKKENTDIYNNLVLLVPTLQNNWLAKRNQERIKIILLLATNLMSIPSLKFHNVPDAKSLWSDIISR
ncbi:hypothetical protein Tco_1105469 [Tanacetum coccineum]